MIDTTDLKRNVDLAALVANDLGPPARRHGRWLLWRCPFHNDHKPSLGVTADNGQWHCFGCGKWGDAIAWLMEREGLTFREACERLGAMTDLPPVPAPSNRIPQEGDDGPPPTTWQAQAQAIVNESVAALWSEAGQRARAWLHKRGLQDETLQRWQVGYNPADCKINGLWVPRGIVVPCWYEGALWTVQVRRLAGEPKYIAIKGSRVALFGTETLADHDVAILCEGMFDAMLLEQECGDLVGVASSTAPMSRWRPFWSWHFLHCRRVFVAYDNDEAGEEHAPKLLATWPRARRARVPLGKDVTDFWKMGGRVRDWAIWLLARDAASSQQAELDADASREPSERITLRWPGDKRGVACVAGQWRRLQGGGIEATYTREELETTLMVMEAIRGGRP